MIVDYEDGGTVVGIEITSPQIVTASHLDELLTQLGLSPLAEGELAPLAA